MCVYKEAYDKVEKEFFGTDKIEKFAQDLVKDEDWPEEFKKMYVEAYVQGYNSALMDVELTAAFADK